jgi:hypothetical protein
MLLQLHRRGLPTALPSCTGGGARSASGSGRVPLLAVCDLFGAWKEGPGTRPLRPVVRLTINRVLLSLILWLDDVFSFPFPFSGLRFMGGPMPARGYLINL